MKVCNLREIVIILLIVMSVIMLSSCETTPAEESVSATRLLLSTYCTITIHGSEDVDLLEQAFELAEELESLLSMTIPGSDIYRINAAGGEPVIVDSGTIEVILAGIEFGELSGGMFDITIGRLSRLWDFGNQERIPYEFELILALATVDYKPIIVDAGINTVKLENPEAWIDLGAIAKGFIADEIADFLIAKGITSALINLGGDITTVGGRYDGNPWLVAVRNPFGSDGDWIEVLEIVDSSVAASGTYERGFDENGIHYHHILDPFTGMPVGSDVVSATVVADTAMTAEGLSTIAVLAGSDGVQDLFSNTPGFIGAVIVLDNEEVLVFGDISFSG